MNKPRRRGLTLVEVLVAAAVSVLLLLVVHTAFRLVGNFTGASRGSVEARRNLRSLLLHLERDFRSACFVFTNYEGPAMGREVFLAPEAADSSELIFAIPETDFGPRSYTVCGVFLERREPPDPANYKAHRIVYCRTPGVVPPIPDSPQSIPLHEVDGSAIRVFDAYVPADGLRFRVIAGGDAIELISRYAYVPPRGPVQGEVYRSLLVARNR